MLLSAALVIAYGISVSILLERSYRQSLDDAAASLQRMARSIEIGTTRSLSAIDFMLIGIQRSLVSAMPGTSLDDPAVTRLLRRFDEQTMTIRSLLVFDNRGRIVNSTEPVVSASADYRNRSFLSEARRDASSTLLIGAPMRSRSGSWSVMVSRPLRRGGERIGAIAAEVPMATFTDFIRAIVGSSGIKVMLVRRDGVAIAGNPDQPPGFGDDRGAASALLAAAAKESAGLLELPSDREGGDALYAFRRLTSYPLFVSVSRDRGEILRPWYRECMISLATFLLFALIAIVVTALVVGALTRQQLAALGLRRSEGRLKRQSALLQSTLESMGEGLSVFDSRGRLIARNRRFHELLDLPSELSAGTSLRAVLMMQALRGDFGDNAPEAEVASRLERFYGEVPSLSERVTPAGRVIQIRRRAMPDGAVLSMYSDVTEIKASERKLIEARSQAELANRSKSDFLANMSHELRTPLNAIIGFSEVIYNELFGPIKNKKYVEYMKDIHASSLHLLSIINDVLDMSKIEAGRLELSKQMLTADRIVLGAVRMVQERARNRGIELLTQLPVEEMTFWADERAMTQILLNLLSNAIKFSHDGGSVWMRAATDETGSAIFEIEDRGIGMDVEEQVRALQPFGQAQSATTRNFGGTGLGLPITKGLVAAHDGALAITSHPGRGTLVRLVLPARDRVDPAPARLPVPATAESG